MTEEFTVSNDVAVDDLTPEETALPMSGGSPEESGETGANQESKQEEKEPLFSEEGQKVFNAKMAEAKRQQRDLEAEKQKYADQLEQMQAKLPQNQEPQVPDIPSEYDFDTSEQYQEAVRARDSKIQERAQWETQERFREMQAQQKKQAQQLAEQERAGKILDKFQDSAKKLGVDEQELNLAIHQVNAYGIQQDLGMHIMERSDGPLVAKYLASNPLELDALSEMTPFQAAIYVESQIAPKAAGLKKRTTSAPDPLDPPRGAGQPPKDRGPKGATYT